MAQIIAKAFDATKRIVRSVFLGSPNLFTTSDVNRQIEALKYQIDQLDDKVGYFSDLQVSFVDSGNGTFTLEDVSFSYLYAKGCDFSNDVSIENSYTISNISLNSKAYFVLRGDKRVVKYADDPTHEIAGAKFDDDSSAPAADQIVYENVHLDLTTNPSDDTIAVLGVITRKQPNSVYQQNTRPLDDSAFLLLKDDTILNEAEHTVGVLTWKIHNNILIIKISAGNYAVSIRDDYASIIGVTLGESFDKYIRLVFNSVPWTYQGDTFKQKFIRIGAAGQGQYAEMEGVSGPILNDFLDYGLCINCTTDGEGVETWVASIGFTKKFSSMLINDSSNGLVVRAVSASPAPTIALSNHVVMIPLPF